MENLDKPGKAKRGRPPASKKYDAGSPKTLKEVKLAIHIMLDGDDIRCTMDVPEPETTSQAMDNAEKLGTLLGVLQNGKLLPVINYALARCGIITNRQSEFEYAMKAMHVAMDLGLPGSNEQKPVVSPTEAFLFRKEI